MNDPTYIKSEIESNPIWKLAWWLSEIENDNAPIGWSRYINLASSLLRKFEMKEK
jgi:hypothetical protein